MVFLSKELDINIINSGSDGNCVRINNVMVDVGIAFSRIKTELFKVDTILLTHRHGDHVKLSAIKQIFKKFPNIKIMGNIDVFNYIFYETGYAIDIVSDKDVWKYKDIQFEAFYVPHDVPCLGYAMNIDGYDLIYVTDSAGTSTWLDRQFDYLLIEYNHCHNKLMEIAPTMKGKYNPIKSAKRHTSVQEADYYRLTHSKPNAKYFELHKSKRFY